MCLYFAKVSKGFLGTRAGFSFQVLAADSATQAIAKKNRTAAVGFSLQSLVQPRGNQAPFAVSGPAKRQS